MNKNLCKLKQYLKDTSADAIVITDPNNMRYLASYTGEGYLVITDAKDYLVTDFRYIIQAHTQAPDFKVCDVSDFDPAAEFALLKKVYFENNTIGYSTYERLKKSFGNLVPAGDVLHDMRAVKDCREAEIIKKAQTITDKAFSHILGFLKPGISEREVALEIEFFMRKNGAEGASFDVIAATGAHGAMPHAEPDGRKIEAGDFVVMDFGCLLEGYRSDMTRTVCVGKATDEMKKIYHTVLSAQLSSLELIREGAIPSQIHMNAQRIIDEAYPGSFGHGLGHGVGMDIHEKPNLSPRNSVPLRQGNVVTVEPGIYIDGFCGVRIEDMVMVTADGYINFTASDKKIIEL